MTDQHLITPPPDLVEQWYEACVLEGRITYDEYKFAALAAQWGADQELEACCEWMFCELITYEIVGRDWRYIDFELRAARRPQPPSLKEQALAALHAVATGANDTREQHQDFDTIRKALEQLNDE